MSITSSYRKGFKFEPENDVLLEMLEKKEDEKAKRNRHCIQRLTRMHNLQWCNCTNCSIMPSDVENLCCSEVAAVKQKLQSHKCITFSSSFAKICLDVDVLQVLITALSDFIGETINAELCNRNYRFSSYRSYIYWIYGKIGKNRRKVIPACVVLAIRNRFPETSGVYEGYHNISPSICGANTSV